MYYRHTHRDTSKALRAWLTKKADELGLDYSWHHVEGEHRINLHTADGGTEYSAVYADSVIDAMRAMQDFVAYRSKVRRIVAAGDRAAQMAEWEASLW